MIKSLRLLACAGLLACSAAASAGGFAFQYTMADQTLITGTFYGNAYGNVVQDIQYLFIQINGVPIPARSYLHAYSLEGNYGEEPPARLSFNGLDNSIMVIDHPLDSALADVVFATGSFYTNGGTDTLFYHIPGGAFQEESPGYGSTGPYAPSRWRLTALSPVPEPATYAMLLGGLALLGSQARRRKPA